MARQTDRPAITIAVDLGRKATKQTKNQTPMDCFSQTLTQVQIWALYLDLHILGDNSWIS